MNMSDDDIDANHDSISFRNGDEYDASSFSSESNSSSADDEKEEDDDESAQARLPLPWEDYVTVHMEDGESNNSNDATETTTRRRRELCIQYVDDFFNFGYVFSEPGGLELDFLDGIIEEFDDDGEILLHILQFLHDKCYEFTASYEKGAEIADSASLRLRDDEDFMFKTCQLFPSTTEYASDRLLDDDEFTNKIVTERGDRLRNVSPRLQNDRKTVLAAISNDPRSFNYASDDLRGNKEFLISILKLPLCGCCLQFAHEDMCDDEEVASAFIRNNMNKGRQRYFWKYLSPRLRDDTQFVLESMEILGGDVLHYASPRLQNDFHTVLTAVKMNWRAIRFASTSLIRNIDILVASKLNHLNVPQTDIFLNQRQTPTSVFPKFFQRTSSFHHREVHASTIIYYFLKNRPDLIPSSSTIPLATRKRKRG